MSRGNRPSESTPCRPDLPHLARGMPPCWLAAQGPDLVVGFAPGYRASWQTALGGAPAGILADNRRLWSGDHIVDPPLVPGLLAANRPLARDGLHQLDVAPTVLSLLGQPATDIMRGTAFL